MSQNNQNRRLNRMKFLGTRIDTNSLIYNN